MEAITFLSICVKLGYLCSYTQLKAEHAGTVYSSSRMKINCASTRFYPNVTAHTSEVILLHRHRHYLGWATEAWITADEEMHRETRKGPYVSTAVARLQGKLWVTFSCISERWPAITVTVLGWKNNAFNTVMSFHPLAVDTVSQHVNKIRISDLEKRLFC